MLEIVGDRRFDIDQSGCGFADRDLVHVHQLARGVHRPSFCKGDHCEGARHAKGGQAGAVDGIDGDVDKRWVAVPDPLAVEQHWGFVLLALADDDDPVHVDGRQHGAHRVDRGLINLVLVAAPLPAGGGHGGSLGDADQLEGKVSVRLLAHVLLHS